MRIGLDLDGTLITCQPKHCSLMRAVAKADGVSVCVEEYWLRKRLGDNNVQSLAHQGIERNIASRLDRHWRSAIESHEWLGFDSVLPRVGVTLDGYRAAGHTLHLISARNNKPLAMLQLRTLGLDHLFSTIDFRSGSAGESKLESMADRRLDLYIGDTELDLEFTRRANVEAILVTTGMRAAEYCMRLPAHALSGLPEPADIGATRNQELACEPSEATG